MFTLEACVSVLHGEIVGLSVQGVGLGRKTLKLKPGHNPYALIVSIVDKPANSKYTYPGSV